MSGQWEVVGKKKDKSSNKSSPKKSNDLKVKKAENLNVKLEDVLAKSQVKNLYANNRIEDIKSVKSNKQDNESKKAVNNKKREKVEAPPKPKAPKSVAGALKLVNADEFNAIFEKSCTQFPDAPIIMLKELVHFLNMKIAVEVPDPIFSAYSLKYPLINVPSEIIAVIDKAIKTAKPSNVQLFFDICLSAMATDMNKNLPCLGYKIFLQYIARAEPALVVANMDKHVVLRNSYMNRPNIGLSILWAVGQVGFEDFQLGIKVFDELMFFLWEKRHYSRYITTYLINLIGNSKQDAYITKEEYLHLLDRIFSVKQNIPNDLRKQLIDDLSILTRLVFTKHKKENTNNLRQSLVEKLPLHKDIQYRNSICDVLINSFSLEELKKTDYIPIYKKSIDGTDLLLQYIGDNWETVTEKVQNKTIDNLLAAVREVNQEYIRDFKSLNQISRLGPAMEKIYIKMTPDAPTHSRFLFKFLILFIVVAYIYIYVTEPKSREILTWEGFKKTDGYKSIIESGEYVRDKVYWVSDKVEIYLPGYQKQAYLYMEPYIELAGNLSLVAWNIGKRVLENEKLVATTETVKNRTLMYLEENFNITDLSQEKMQQFVLEAFNTTQIKATECYQWVYENCQWIYEKVQTAIK